MHQSPVMAAALPSAETAPTWRRMAASWFADLSADEAQLLFDLLSRVELRARRALSPDPGTAGRPPR